MLLSNDSFFFKLYNIYTQYLILLHKTIYINNTHTEKTHTRQCIQNLLSTFHHSLPYVVNPQSYENVQFPTFSCIKSIFYPKFRCLTYTFRVGNIFITLHLCITNFASSIMFQMQCFKMLIIPHYIHSFENCIHLTSLRKHLFQLVSRGLNHFAMPEQMVNFFSSSLQKAHAIIFHPM